MDDCREERQVTSFGKFVLVKIPGNEINTVFDPLLYQSFSCHGDNIPKIEKHRCHSRVTVQKSDSVSAGRSSNIKQPFETAQIVIIGYCMSKLPAGHMHSPDE